MILFVCDDFAKSGDPFFDSLNLLRPGAARVVGIGDACGEFAFGFSEVFEHVIEFLLECRSAHGNRLSGVGDGVVVAADGILARVRKEIFKSVTDA